MTGCAARKGLSLLEVMIVLVILVGLITVVGPRLLGTQKKADIRTAQLQIGNVVQALKMYASDMRSFPTTEEGLELLVRPPEDEALAKNWDGPYLEDGKLPIDPWGSPLQYEYEPADREGSFGRSSDSEEFSADFPLVFSLGPDRQPGTADDISNRTPSSDEKESAARP